MDGFLSLENKREKNSAPLSSPHGRQHLDSRTATRMSRSKWMGDEAGLRRKNFPQVSVGKMRTWGGRAKRSVNRIKQKNLHDKAHFLFFSLARACGSTEMASEFLQSRGPPPMFRVLRVLPICVRGPAAPQAPASAHWLVRRVPGWHCDAATGPDGGPCRAREGYSPL